MQTDVFVQLERNFVPSWFQFYELFPNVSDMVSISYPTTSKHSAFYLNYPSLLVVETVFQNHAIHRESHCQLADFHWQSSNQNESVHETVRNQPQPKHLDRIVQSHH